MCHKLSVAITDAIWPKMQTIHQPGHSRMQLHMCVCVCVQTGGWGIGCHGDSDTLDPTPCCPQFSLDKAEKMLGGRQANLPSLSPFFLRLSFLPPPFPFRSLFLSLWGLVTELEGTWVINVEFKWAYQVKSSFAPLGYSPLMKNSSDKLTVQYHIVNTDDSPRFITKQNLHTFFLLLREKGISQLNFIV